MKLEEEGVNGKIGKGIFLSGREGIKARVDIKAEVREQEDRDERREIAVDTDQNKGKRLRRKEGKGKKDKDRRMGKRK